MLISHFPALLVVSRPADIAPRPQPRRLFDNRKLTAADGAAGELRPLAVQRDSSGLDATGRDREATESATEGFS
jgi:hypothetical protein